MTISNRLGLHARPAARFARMASGFRSRVWLVRDGEAVDGKSILEVLTLACPKGTRLIIRASGPDAQLAVDTLCQLVTDSFGELD
ncbi:HPr family phosphocarrier protein [Dissulfurirhabdus thermomarina]|uniref:HPr family phosphocarrier protein n=1 Tax=Dissulfurirhabdus thermomarina TaxID=1765737 RepID=UPI002852E632|nr:HPr family phosphocarrier protein [Dissulfurirhabdus thermomarina]